MAIFHIYQYIKEAIFFDFVSILSSATQCILFNNLDAYMNIIQCIASVMDEHRLYLNAIYIFFECRKLVFDHFIFFHKMKHYDFQ